MGRLEGKVAIITGAGQGIGLGYAERFLAEGAKVVVAELSEARGAAAMAALEGKGEFEYVRTDIADPDSAQACVDATVGRFGTVDILVNNAALNYYLPTETYPTSRWFRCFAVNVHGPFMLSKEVLKDMIPKRSGAIINISSGSAIGPGRGPYEDQHVYGGVMYGATKAALERFTQGLAQEVAQYGGISIAALSPSRVVPTPGTIHFKLVTGMDDPKGEPPILMARSALLLASEPAAKINGRVTYSQQILKEYGWIEQASGRGVDTPGSGYSQV